MTDAVKAVAAGKRAAFIRDETVDDVHLRVLTRRGPNGEALQIARSLTEADATLGRLRWVLAAVMLGGVGLAAALGLAVSRAATRPLARLTATAEQVTATGELHHRIPVWRRRRAGPAGRRRSTPCCRPWRARATRSASSSPTPRTSCARR